MKSDEKWMSNFRMIQFWSRVKKMYLFCSSFTPPENMRLEKRKTLVKNQHLHDKTQYFVKRSTPIKRCFSLNSEDFQGLLWVRVKWFSILEGRIKSLRSLGHYGCHESWVFSCLVLHSHSTLKINHMKWAHFTIRLFKTTQETMTMTCVWYKSIRIPC